VGAVAVENHAGQRASDNQLVAALLACGNGHDVVLLTRPLLGAERKAFIAERQGSQGALRAQVCKWLESALEDRAGFARAFTLPLLQSLAALEIKAVMAITTRGLVLDYYHKFSDEQAALLYALMLLLDTGRPYGRALRRCLFCERYYLAAQNRRGGPPNNFYCRPEHRIIAHERGRADRARRQKADIARMKK
jgi:hypothetical protein